MSFFTSESVSRGHPDKMADQISDAIVTHVIKQNPQEDLRKAPRCAIETMLKNNNIFIAGETSMPISGLDLEKICHSVLADIGCLGSYGTYADIGGVRIHNYLDAQSLEISNAVISNANIGAGDQGMVFGFACKDNECMMPAPIYLAHKIVEEYQRYIKSNLLFGPDAKAQVTVEYKDGVPFRIDTVVFSAQHSENMIRAEMMDCLKKQLIEWLPQAMLDKDTRYFVNPSGSFVVGGPFADAGLTGRKIIVDTYGSFARHGGGAFSGKDVTKVDRSGAYIARYIAKHVVASGVANSCEIQISYAIGVAEPVSVCVELKGNKNGISDQAVISAIKKTFDLTPAGIYKELGMYNEPDVYYASSQNGHFGKAGFPWESLRRVDELVNNIKD